MATKRQIKNRPESQPKDMWEREFDIAGAGGKEEVKYDIDLGFGPGGEILAPGGVTASQMAIMMPGMFGVSPEDIKRATGTTKEPPLGGKPPEGYQPIDYSLEGRKKFEEQVIGQIGFHPMTFSQNEYLEKAMQELPQLFDYVFEGKVLWADRDKLTKDQQALWVDAIKTFRATVWKEAQEKQEVGLRQYNYMMNRFDKEAALKEKALGEMRKAPTTKNIWDPEKKAKVIHEWDPKKRQWVSTGQLAEKPEKVKKGMPEDIKESWQIVKALMGAYGGEDIGDAPAGEADFVAKYQAIMSLLGSGQVDPRLKNFYETHLERLLNYFGVSPEPKPTGGEKGKGGQTKTYKGKDGKTYTVTITK